MLIIENVNKSYKGRGDDVKIFNDLSLKIRDEEFISLVGPNGCGKTTLFNLIAGFDKDFTGNIKINKESGVGFVFQNYKESLFPWLTASENISYPLKIKGVKTNERRDRVINICKEFNIHIPLDEYPYKLSGGQQQMISILRSLIASPGIILMDEPFSSLDYETTLFLRSKLMEIWSKAKISVLFISHDIEEALMLSQKVFLLSNKPTRIIKKYEVNLHYPRNNDILKSSEFIKIKMDLLNKYQAEIVDN